MSPSPWFIAVNVLAIIVFMLCTFVVALCTGVVVWTLRRLDAVLAPAMGAVVAVVKPLSELAENLENVATVASELKDLQEGDVNAIRAQVKAVNELRATIEEFEQLLVPAETSPSPARRRRGAGGTDEQAEMAAERRKAERQATTSVDAEFLEERAKHGGVV